MPEDHPLRDLNSNLYRGNLSADPTKPQFFYVAFPYWDEIDPRLIFGGFTKPKFLGLRTANKSENQWLIDYVNDVPLNPNQPPILLSVGLNVGGSEDFVLELKHFITHGTITTEISRRQYTFEITDWYSQLKGMLGGGAITILQPIVHIEDGKFTVTLKSGNTGLTSSITLSCTSPWSGREDRGLVEIIALIRAQLAQMDRWTN